MILLNVNEKGLQKTKSFGIKGIIFDYGGVLSSPGNHLQFCEKFAPKYNVDAEELYQVIRENWHKARINEINSAKFWNNLAKFVKTNPKKIKKELLSFHEFNQELLDWAKKLKNNYKLGLLSNHIKDWFGKEIKEHKLNNIFGIIITSYDVRIAKPDIKIFKLIINKIKLNPKECVYIDDKEKNIPPALKLGMNAIQYKNNSQLKRELSKLGIII